MPDIENRDRREAAIALVLRGTLGEFRDRLLAALGDPPNVANVPQSLWTETEEQIDAKTRAALATVFLLAMLAMRRRTGHAVDAEIAGDQAAAYAQQQAQSLAQSTVATFRQQLGTATAEAAYRQATGTLTPRQALLGLERRIREIAARRAEVAGVTETTAANSAGELWYRTAYEAETGEELRVTWRTEAGACPVCRPLNRADEATWRNVFPQGPPAHPGCRCWLDFAVI